MSEDKNEKSALVPRRRFPEFHSEPWEAKPLEEVAPLQRGFDLPSSELQPGGIPVVYSNGVQSFHSTAMAKAPGLITGRSGTIGKLHFIEKGEYWPHNTSLWVTSFKGNVPKFVYFLFDSIGIERFASGSGVPTLNRNDVHTFMSAVPKALDEQQKIADCLSSLDDLITVEAQKLDALKTHKKGLMQRLFPRKDETVPRLRFPEFREAGEWEEIALGDVCERIMDGTHFSPASKSGSFLYLTSKNVRPGALVLDDVSYISADEHRSIFARCPVKKNDLLLTKDGASTGNCTLNPLDFEFSLLSSVAVIRGDPKKILQEFLAQDFQSSHVQDQIADAISGQAITRITLEKLKRFKVWITSSHEQQRISACLASFDDLILSQNHKIDALKAHKKGLMQQLFPVLAEVPA